ncbi:hypothetical protein I598_2616 [Isoptericola dokdonensis DS-3]|uniref:Uncharacterized protein n=1 Tax=Isoptericola dokdonensis DS-3 TaxID=1300344 RepID=A0A168FMN5_9MICO|nr:hypothetical protein I598_2616 [Isoptericola dokdonensis DS-3]
MYHRGRADTRQEWRVEVDAHPPRPLAVPRTRVSVERHRAAFGREASPFVLRTQECTP